jgi:hypothetical protein
VRRWASSRATRGGQERQTGASDGAVQRPVAALLRGRGGAEEEERGERAPGAEL